MKACIFGKQFEIRTEAAVIIVSVLVLLGCLIGYFFFRDDSDIIIETDAALSTGDAAVPAGQEMAGTAGSKDAGAADTLGVDKDAEGVEQIKVYVVGCVKEPGIVTLEKGQLIDDAVRLAGGLTDKADSSSINMVYKLEENLMLYIKSKSELVTQPRNIAGKTTIKNTAVNTAADNAANTALNGSIGKGAAIIKDSGESTELIGDGEDNSSGGGQNPRVNINTADADELDTLPGVGEATAKDIIAFREKNGPFRKVEDIMKVPRIKQGRFESVKEFITVQ